jgi:F-type H+-transporting ATPase subunit gamma
MATLRDIKTRIGSIISIEKITQAMKMVATAKLRKAQNQVESARPYFIKLESSISKIISSLEGDYNNPLIEKPNEIKNIAVIVISSDRGMCGSFNTNLFKDTSIAINNAIPHKYPNAKISVLPIGKKAISFFNKLKFPIIKQYSNIADNADFTKVKDIIDDIKIKFLNSEFDLVLVQYVRFINIIKQIPSQMQLLPLPTGNKEEKESAKFNFSYIYEPDKTAILDELIPQLIDSKMWAAILESNTAEQASRRVAMDNATSNANDLIKNLNLVYNKVRQANITREIIEIVSGANALKGTN